MRIVGGAWRGRNIEAPEGRGTRPTTDRMRESLASAIMSAMGLSLEGVSVLDAFAGSGGVGLELLSRGAEHCTFCERNRRAARIVEQNAASLGVPKSRYAVICADVMKLAGVDSVAGSPFGLVFLDPPYAMAGSEVSRLVTGLMKAGMLSDDCLVVYERSSDGDALVVEGLVTLRTKKQGGTCTDILRKEGQQ